MQRTTPVARLAFWPVQTVPEYCGEIKEGKLTRLRRRTGDIASRQNRLLLSE